MLIKYLDPGEDAKHQKKRVSSAYDLLAVIKANTKKVMEDANYDVSKPDEDGFERVSTSQSARIIAQKKHDKPIAIFLRTIFLDDDTKDNTNNRLVADLLTKQSDIRREGDEVAHRVDTDEMEAVIARAELVERDALNDLYSFCVNVKTTDA